MNDAAIISVAHAIQLAVAPVFLLTGIGAILATMAGRLARVVDRASQIRERIEQFGEKNRDPELGVLSRRARLISWAIALCTTTALLVSTVIAILFMGASLGFDASRAVAILFVGSMLTFIVGLLLFLREVLLASKALSVFIRNNNPYPE